jgi:hypothetical protein
MAEVVLTRAEVQEGGLPLTCLVCGEAAQNYVKKKFQHVPWWVYLPAALGLAFVPLLFLAVILLVIFPQPSMTVHAPLCYRHKHHWRWRNRIIGGGAIAAVFLAAGSVIFVNLSIDSLLLSDHPRILAFVPLLVLLACAELAPPLLVIGYIVLTLTAVHAREIFSERVRLTPVAEEFIEALRVHRLERMPAPG